MIQQQATTTIHLTIAPFISLIIFITVALSYNTNNASAAPPLPQSHAPLLPLDPNTLSQNRHLTPSSTNPVKGHLITTFSSETGSYGNMFDVHVLSNPITIETIEFYTDLNATTVDYLVYTKRGSHENYTKDISAWTLIANNTILSAGKGRGTMVPREDFTAVRVEADAIQGFYVTLTTYDIRYTRGTELGAVYVANADLEILEGTGIATFPLKRLTYAPRVWNGGIYYHIHDIPTPAPTVSMAPSMYPTPKERPVTPVTFYLGFQHPYSTTHGEIIPFVDNKVDDYLMEEFRNGELNVEDLHVLNIKTTVTAQTAKHAACAKTKPDFVCGYVETIAYVSHPHRTMMDMDVLVSVIKSYNNPIQDTLKFGTKEVSTDFKVSMGGKTLPDLTKPEEKEIFENEVIDFLVADLATKGEEIVDLKRVEIKYVKGDSGDDDKSRGSSRRRYLYNDNYVSNNFMDVLVTITGEYQPPPEVDLGNVVEDSFEANGETFLNNLKENEQFQGLEEMTVKVDKAYMNVSPVETKTTKEVQTTGQLSIIILGIIIGGAAILIVVMFLILSYWKRKKENDNSKRRVTFLMNYDGLSDNLAASRH